MILCFRVIVTYKVVQEDAFIFNKVAFCIERKPLEFLFIALSYRRASFVWCKLFPPRFFQHSSLVYNLLETSSLTLNHRDYSHTEVLWCLATRKLTLGEWYPNAWTNLAKWREYHPVITPRQLQRRDACSRKHKLLTVENSMAPDSSCTSPPRMQTNIGSYWSQQRATAIVYIKELCYHNILLKRYSRR